MRDAYKKRGRKIRLEEDILDVWREYGDAGIKRVVQEFKAALNLRHWLRTVAIGSPNSAVLGMTQWTYSTFVEDCCKQ